MKKQSVRSLLGLLLVFALLLPGAALGGRQGKTAVSACGIEEWNDLVCLIPSSIPEGVPCRSGISGDVELEMGLKDELATAGSIELISGDPSFGDVFNCYGPGEENGVIIVALPETVTQAGNAIFRLFLESEHYWYENEVPVRAVTYDDLGLTVLQDRITVETQTFTPVDLNSLHSRFIAENPYYQAIWPDFDVREEWIDEGTLSVDRNEYTFYRPGTYVLPVSYICKSFYFDFTVEFVVSGPDSAGEADPADLSDMDPRNSAAMISEYFSGFYFSRPSGWTKESFDRFIADAAGGVRYETRFSVSDTAGLPPSGSGEQVLEYYQAQFEKYKEYNSDADVSSEILNVDGGRPLLLITRAPYRENGLNNAAWRLYYWAAGQIFDMTLTVTWPEVSASLVSAGDNLLRPIAESLVFSRDNGLAVSENVDPADAAEFKKVQAGVFTLSVPAGMEQVVDMDGKGLDWYRGHSGEGYLFEITFTANPYAMKKELAQNSFQYGIDIETDYIRGLGMDGSSEDPGWPYQYRNLEIGGWPAMIRYMNPALFPDSEDTLMRMTDYRTYSFTSYREKGSITVELSVIDLYAKGGHSERLAEPDYRRIQALIDRIEYTPGQARSDKPNSGSNSGSSLPKNAKLTLSPAKLTAWRGQEITLTAGLNADAPLDGLAWSFKGSKNGDPDLTDNGGGSVTLRFHSTGTVTVTASIGNKSAKSVITVGEPVTGLKITGKDTCKKGKTLALKAELTPKKPAVKTVEWSLDVDGSIATIDGKGKLKVKKDAPEGTKITVTCTAVGANEPVTASMVVTVTK